MGYHNVRDKNGRFAKKKGKSSGFGNRYKVTRRVAKTPAKQLTTYDMFIIDESGSMGSVINETLDGFNTIIKDLKKVSEKKGLNSRASLILFNSSVKGVFDNIAISKVENLTKATYSPTSMTALYDAIKRGIREMKEVVNSPKASVNIHIFTDGHENASTTSLSEVQELIKEVRDDYNWTVTFIGAGDLTDVQAVAGAMGIFGSNTLNYRAGSAGTKKAFASISSASVASRTAYSATGSSSNMGFFSTDIDDDQS